MEIRKVLIVGATQELGRTEELYGRGFVAFGCKVEHFSWEQEIEPIFSSKTLLDRAAWRIGWKALAKAANKKLIDLAQKIQPNLIFVISPNLVHPKTIQALQQYSPVFVFFTDNPLDNHHTHSNSWVRRGLSLWDAVLIWSESLVTQLKAKGANNCFFHAFSSDTQIHFPKIQSQPEFNVAFIGNWDPELKREKYLDAISDCKLGVWGTNYWLNRCHSFVGKNCYQGMCSYAEIPDILGKAKIGLNILRVQNESGHNIRTFEIPATRTLMLSEKNEELMKIFKEDKEAVYFSSPKDLRKKVDFLLRRGGLIKSIAEKGYQKALDNTIENRIAEIHKIYQEQSSAAR